MSSAPPLKYTLLLSSPFLYPTYTPDITRVIVIKHTIMHISAISIPIHSQARPANSVYTLVDEAIPHIFLKSISCRISGLATLWLLIYILIKPIAMKINADISDHTILISVDMAYTLGSLAIP